MIPMLSSKFIHRTLLAMLVWMTSLCAVQADDWPNWNGSNHDGISRETGFADAWPKDGLPIEWTCEIGTGFSSMSVAGERLFAMGHKDGEETVWCLNRRTGQVLWSHRYPGELIPNLHEGGPCATPTVDGDRVYTVGKEGQLFCLNMADGKVLWEKMLQQDLEVKLPEWGFSSSPRILGNQLILEAVGLSHSINRTAPNYGKQKSMKLVTDLPLFLSMAAKR